MKYLAAAGHRLSISIGQFPDQSHRSTRSLWMSERRYYLGVDAGGTKTHAAIADQDGRIVGVGQAGTGNWEIVGLKGAARTLERALKGALRATGLCAPDLAGAGYGL